MMARALALNGAHKVYIVGRRKEVLENASKSVSTNNIIPLVGGVTSKEALYSIVSRITSEVGYINLLVANSGILGPQAAQKITSESTVADFQKAWGESSFEEFADTFMLNTVAVWYTITAFLGLLDAGNKKGNVGQKSQVIATSSIGGFQQKCAGRLRVRTEQSCYNAHDEAVGHRFGTAWYSIKYPGTWMEVPF